MSAAAATADIVIEADIIGVTTTAPAETKPVRSCGLVDPDWRIVHLKRVLRGEGKIPASASQTGDLKIIIGRLGGSTLPCNELTTCDTRPTVGQTGVWAVKLVDGILTFADVCTTLATRAMVTKDGKQ